MGCSQAVGRAVLCGAWASLLRRVVFDSNSVPCGSRPRAPCCFFFLAVSRHLSRLLGRPMWLPHRFSRSWQLISPKPAGESHWSRLSWGF